MARAPAFNAVRYSQQRSLDGAGYLPLAVVRQPLTTQRCRSPVARLAGAPAAPSPSSITLISIPEADTATVDAASRPKSCSRSRKTGDQTSARPPSRLRFLAGGFMARGSLARRLGRVLIPDAKRRRIGPERTTTFPVRICVCRPFGLLGWSKALRRYCRRRNKTKIANPRRALIETFWNSLRTSSVWVMCLKTSERVKSATGS